MITLQFVQGNDWQGQLIEWFSHGADYCHVDTVMPDGKLLGARSDNVGGAEPGVQLRDPSYVGEAKTLRVDLSVTADQMAKYFSFLSAQLGKPYDMEGILAFISGRDWHQTDSWFCSELVAAGLEACGFFQWPLATSSNKVTPPDLLLAISSRQKVQLLS